MTNLIEELLAKCTFPEGPVVCAVSGGADSMALLALASATKRNVKAIHVDHGIRAGSEKEADLVHDVAKRFNADFEARKVHVESGPNLESRARLARYSVLPEDVLTGHTADDQAETILLALIRGSAWHGLSGMRPSVRKPILNLRRSETEALCEALKIEFFNDPSNQDLKFRRNRIRNEALPLLNEIAERDLAPLLARQADVLRAGADYITQQTMDIDPTDCETLIKVHPVLAREAIRNWIWKERNGNHPPDLATIERVLNVARLEMTATDIGGGWRVARTNRILRIEPPEEN
ncbi:MAG: tRNA lysidine(34) synthetase TilS [Actinomycetota bacterium]